jgi:hypothetical protein
MLVPATVDEREVGAKNGGEGNVVGVSGKSLRSENVEVFRKRQPPTHRERRLSTFKMTMVGKAYGERREDG